MRTRTILTSAAVLTAALGLALAPMAKADPKNNDVAEVVKGNNEFAFDLYGQLRKKDGNVFFSPSSISTALAMTYEGARGQTEREMAKTLHVPSRDKLRPAYSELLRQWNGSSQKRPYDLNVANALWIQKDAREGIKADFFKATHDFYNAEAREIAFAFNNDKARREINTWVEKHTRGRIREM